MNSKDRDLRVGETVYWVRWNRTPSGFRGKTVLYSRIEIIALKEHTVQIDERQFVPYGSIHKLDSFKTLEVRDQKGKLRTIIPDSIKIRTSGGGNYTVEGVDFNLGYNITLFQASGKGSVTACKKYFYTCKPDQREIEAREKEELQRREEERLREAELKEAARKAQYALDEIKRKEILQSYLQKEGTDALSTLRKAFLRIFPKDILTEADNCIAAGIDVDTVMREGMVAGYLRAFQWLYEQKQDDLIFFPEIMAYNREVFQKNFLEFKSCFNPKPLNDSPHSPILIFSTLASVPSSQYLEGMSDILEIPVVKTYNEYDLQKIERLVDENGIKTIVCFLVREKQLFENKSNDLNCMLVERMHRRTDLQILVASEDRGFPTARIQRLNASNVTTCHSLFEVLSHFNTDVIDGWMAQTRGSRLRLLAWSLPMMKIVYKLESMRGSSNHGITYYRTPPTYHCRILNGYQKAHQ